MNKPHYYYHEWKYGHFTSCFLYYCSAQIELSGQKRAKISVCSISLASVESVRLFIEQPVYTSYILYVWHMQWLIIDAFLCNALNFITCYWTITLRFIGSVTVPEKQFAKLVTGLSQSPCLSLSNIYLLSYCWTFSPQCLTRRPLKRFDKTRFKGDEEIPQIEDLKSSTNITFCMTLKTQAVFSASKIKQIYKVRPWNHSICYLQWNPNTTIKIWALGAKNIKFVKQEREKQNRNAPVHSPIRAFLFLLHIKIC